ncbi:hypothetical protein CANCADRAFT_17492, partial [Tortispora caseinolytica NRRL Y-17796]
DDLLDTWAGDDVPTEGHQVLREVRQQRHYNRLAAYALPHLADLVDRSEKLVTGPIIIRTTTYMGRKHPSEPKVVLNVDLNSKELGLDDDSIHYMKLLAGQRYDPVKNMIRISCERFTESAQNREWVFDKFRKLYSEAKEGKDKFTDIPVDVRHAKHRLEVRNKKVSLASFPEEWKQ